MKRLIVSDSSCDLRSQPGVLNIVPLTIQMKDKSFVDDETLNLPELLDALANNHGKSGTACPSVQAWINAFEDADEVYVITMTSGLSGTYNSAKVAEEMFLQEHPDTKIVVLDTLATGPEMALVIQKLEELLPTEKTFEEISEIAKAYIENVHLMFALESLHNLAENGRVSKLVASAFDVFGMRLIAVASEEGTIQQLSKSRGDKKSAEKMIVHLKDYHYNGGKMRICHILNEEGANRLRDRILLEWPFANVKIAASTGLCSFYAERGGLMVGFETDPTEITVHD